MKCQIVFGLVILMTGLQGCATVAVDPHAGFPQVAQLVNDRGAPELTWTPGVEESPPRLDAISSRLAEGLTEEEAVRIALLNNRELQALYARLGIAHADLVQASLLHNPVIGVTSGFPIAGGIVDLGFGLAMDLIDFLYTPLRKRVATARFEEAKLRVAADVLDAVWRTQTAFYTHQANEQALEMRRQVAAATAASFNLAQRLREAGNLRELDVATEQALAEEAKADLRFAEIATRDSRERLNLLMGLSGEHALLWTVTPARLLDPREAATNADLEARAMKQSLDLAAADQLIVAAAENVRLDRASALFPEVVVGGKGERDGREWEPGPTFILPLPLFDRGQARIARAQAELRQARELRTALAVRIAAIARSTRARLEGYRERALQYRDVVLPVRQRVLEQTQLQYNAMQIGPLDLLRAKEQQIEAGIRYIDALREYWLAQADHTLLLAGRLPPTEAAPAAPTLEQLPRLPFSTLQ
ncbi:MAG: TolC family protein [Deltaproteobacteria bacterium]|nr:TolC family protein [Deltaproteobacteria bacterium]